MRVTKISFISVLFLAALSAHHAAHAQDSLRPAPAKFYPLAAERAAAAPSAYAHTPARFFPLGARGTVARAQKTDAPRPPQTPVSAPRAMGEDQARQLLSIFPASR